MILVCTNTIRNLRTLRYDCVSMLSQEFQELKLLTLDSCLSFDVNQLFDDRLIHQKSYLKFIYNLLFLFFSKTPRTIVTFTTEAILFVCLIKLFFSMKHICIFTGLGSLFNTPSFKGSIILFFAGPLVKNSDLVVVQNEQDRVHLLNLWKINPEKIKVVNGSGINTNQNFNRNKTHSTTRKSFILVARLIKEKGISDFLEAIKILKLDNNQHLDNMSFTIFGNYDQNNPSCFDSDILEHECKSLGVELIIYDPLLLKTVLDKNSHFVLPSYREGTSKALLEACLANLFPIVSNVPGCNNVVKNNLTGLLFEARNPTDLALTIVKAFEMPCDKTQQMADAARLKVIKKFSVQAVNDEMLKLIKQLN